MLNDTCVYIEFSNRIKLSLYDAISEHFSVLMYSVRQVIYQKILVSILLRFKNELPTKRLQRSKTLFFIISNLLVDNDK